MKRLFAAAILCAVALGMSTSAFAYPVLKHEKVKFRSHRIAGTSTDYTLTRVDAVGSYVDSMSFNRLGATGTTIAVAQAETTCAILTDGWAKPGIGTAVDSCWMFRVTFADAGQHGAGDSILVATQVSPDGKTWAYVNQIAGAAGINPLTSNVVADQSAVLFKLGGGIMFSMAGVAGIGGITYPDRYNCWQWPAIRFIVINEHAATVHNLNCTISHWVESGD
jgi:hypothetical protein